MPELPEVESARAVVERSALHRRITAVDDTDTYVCRPHDPGEISAALLGLELTAARRRGKTMWCETSGDAVLGLHLGMAGRLVATDTAEETAEAEEGRQPQWWRFTLTFADGGSLRLLDKRRLGRVRLDPDLDALGPDAAEIGREEFRDRVGRGTAPLKARLLDQATIAGIGNLLADEVLWQAGLSPQRPAGELDDETLDGLRRELRTSIRAAIRHGGVHTGEIIAHRHRGGHCPSCGAEMQRGVVGGRTTWWCPVEQV